MSKHHSVVGKIRSRFRNKPHTHMRAPHALMVAALNTRYKTRAQRVA